MIGRRGFITGLGVGLAAVAIGVVVAAIITYEVAVWRECMADHPWWYCIRILGR